MGLLQQDAEQWFTLSRGDDDISAEQVEALIAKRNQAKADKDYPVLMRFAKGLSLWVWFWKIVVKEPSGVANKFALVKTHYLLLQLY